MMDHLIEHHVDQCQPIGVVHLLLKTPPQKVFHKVTVRPMDKMIDPVGRKGLG
jgi:hypothetical protein